ncbi:MAG: hypothetical protein WC055_16995 [Melioribacteraceae bacterium]
MVICLISVIYIFYKAAKQVDKSIVLWVSYGITLWLIMGFIFLAITEKYILNITTIGDAFSFRSQKMLLEGISAILIVATAYLIQSKFIKTSKEIN